MRQIFFILSVVFFTFYMASPVMAEEVSEIMLGDVNNNGKIDIGDAVCIVNNLVGKQSDTFIEKAADTNRNGKIDIGDAVTIVNLIVGKISSFSSTVTSDNGIDYGGTDDNGEIIPSSRSLDNKKK